METTNSKGTLKWIRVNKELVLHLKEGNLGQWKPYYSSRYKVKDQAFLSKGYPTFCALIKQGWSVEKTDS